MLTERRVCDVTHNDPCLREAKRYTVFTEGDRQARAVDLCSVHARPIEALLVNAEVVDLPTKPRARMDKTKLRVTPHTAQFKKEKRDGEKGQGERPQGEG